MKTSYPKAGSLKEELRLHSRYIRDTLAPVLSSKSKMERSDVAILRSVFKTLERIDMTIELLQFARIEKALMVITEVLRWPLEFVMRAKELLQKWEDKLGPLKNIRADLYGPGGRLHGVRKIVEWSNGSLRGRDDDAKSAWTIDGAVDPSRAHKFGNLGFQVGDWWIKPAAAFRDGIIDETTYAITADGDGAYAIIVSGNRETELTSDGQFKYHAAQDDPGVFKLTKTMTTDTPKIVRVLRSWKLRSPLAPKTGLRYDGLYRIISFGIRLIPPNDWHYTFTLARVSEQESIQEALSVPTSDMLDDWKDYQRLKNIDQGDDFSFLREIARGPTMKPTSISGNDEKGDDDEVGKLSDSGYLSRKDSGMKEIGLRFVADGTPTVSEPSTPHPETLADENTNEEQNSDLLEDTLDDVSVSSTSDPFDDETTPRPTPAGMPPRLDQLERCQAARNEDGRLSGTTPRLLPAGVSQDMDWPGIGDHASSYGFLDGPDDVSPTSSVILHIRGGVSAETFAIEEDSEETSSALESKPQDCPKLAISHTSPRDMIAKSEALKKLCEGIDELNNVNMRCFIGRIDKEEVTTRVVQEIGEGNGCGNEIEAKTEDDNYRTTNV